MGLPSRLRGFGRCCAALLAWLLGLVALPAIGPELPSTDDQVVAPAPAVNEELPAQRLVVLIAHPPQGPPAVLEAAAASSFSQPQPTAIAVGVVVSGELRLLGFAVYSPDYVGTSDPVNRWDPSGLDDVVFQPLPGVQVDIGGGVMADMGLAIWVGDDGSTFPIGPVASAVNEQGERIFGNIRADTIGVGPANIPFDQLKAVAQQSHNTNVDALDVELSLLIPGGDDPLDPLAVAGALNENVNTVIARLEAQNALSDAFAQLGGVDAVPQQQLPTLINLTEQLAADPEVSFAFTGVREDTQALVGNLVIAGRVVDFAGTTAVELLPVVGTGFAVIRDPTDPTNILGALPFLGAVGVMARGGRNADDIFRNGREIARLARDPARGGERSLREGVAGLKLQRILGRRVERSTVRETDFVFRNDAGIEQTVSLKGPFLPAAVDERALLRGQGQNLVDVGIQSMDDLTQRMIRKFRTDLNDVKVFDLFGLSPSQRRQFVSGLQSGLPEDVFNAIIFLDN